MTDYTKNFRLSTAHLRWQEQVPVSATFDDIYFNTDGGQAESDYVFLEGNHLTERWQLSPKRFTIAETGFGSGLNFLLTRKAWLTQSSPDQHLCYISCERYPMTKHDLEQALSVWSNIRDGSEQLLAQWPPACRGNYLLEFDEGRISLLLLLGDGLERYRQLDAKVDAWYLDGFSPSHNSELWQPELFAQIARLSHSETTLATFTAAGFVRRQLQDVGFSIEKRAGFGRKREMLTATFTSSLKSSSTPVEKLASRPWFQRPISLKKAHHALVIGAGLSGAFTAYELARRGWHVDVIERHAQPAQEGSGNRQGAFYLKPPTRPNPMLTLHLAGYHYSTSLLQRLSTTQPEIASNCGLLDLAVNPRTEAQQRKLIASGLYPDTLLRSVDAHEASHLAGVELTHGGLFLPDSGWAAPAELTRYLLKHPNIRCHYETPAHHLSYDRTHEVWQINDGQFKAPVAILCTAAETDLIRPFADFPLKKIRGQTSVVPISKEVGILKTVVCADGYISPPQEHHYCFGASFTHNDLDTKLRSEDQQGNLNMLSRAIPELASSLSDAPLGGHVAMRASTTDYLPLVGGIGDETWMIQQFSKLRDDANWPHFNDEMRHHPGLYINVGHGAKGLITIPYCARILADLIIGSTNIAEQPLLEALNPARFVIKKLIKRSI